MSDLNNSGRWKKQVNVNTKRMRQLMRDVRADVVARTRNCKDLDEWTEKLAPFVASNVFSTGIYAGSVTELIQGMMRVVDQTSLPSGSNAEILKGVMSESCYTMVTNVGEDIRTVMRQEAVQAYNDKVPPKELANRLDQKLESISKTRCEAIARTETCRAANLGNYLNAKEMGAKSYSVICNEGACEYCIAEYGENMDTVYDIEDIENFPPYHPNCRCTPVWSMKPKED